MEVEKATSEESRLTDYLKRWEGGDRQALDDLVQIVYPYLKGICRRKLQRYPDQALSPTALLSETFLRLARQRRVKMDDRHAFFGFAARLVHDILVDHARKRDAQKRGAGQVLMLSLDDASGLATHRSSRSIDVLDLEQALQELEAYDSDLHEILLLRFYAGLSEREIADLVDRSRASIQRDTSFAFRWLARRLGTEE